MTPKLQISQFVLNRLKHLKNVCGGGLFGTQTQLGSLVILGFDLESTGDDNDKLSFKKMQDNFPTEVDLCGLFKFGDCSDAEAHLQEILKSIDITDNPILLKCNNEDVFELKTSLYRNGKLEEIEYEVLSEEALYKQFFVARLVGYIEIAAELSPQNMKQSFTDMRKKLAYGNALFQLQNKNIFFNNNNIIGLNTESTMQDVLELTKHNDDSSDSNKSKNKKELVPLEFSSINIECLVKKSDENDKTQRAALNISLEKKKLLIPLQIDAIAFLNVNTKAVLLYDILIESLCRTLRLVETNLVDQYKQRSQITIPLTYHFKPNGFGHFYTCILPSAVPDEDSRLTAKRRELHQQFGLQMTKPYFRKANNYNFDAVKSSILINPHIGLKQFVVDGKQSLVQGKYSYHHYMQDSFNDDGWGCAYRSFQTLCSWFRFQGYSDHKIPNHEEVQRYLVKIGDKPASFVKSRQWIGSTEVSMCLNGFMNVDSRIMHVPSGAELSSKGSELAYHFESQGTPIMIGGGVLAHTILGVDFNSSSGELKFLILDPHYTGTEDLQIIQNKGWCNWKGTNFWDKNSYYNLCMPQKPNVF
ncbi:unnamed protein product [Diamesa serratosioi]